MNKRERLVFHLYCAVARNSPILDESMLHSDVEHFLGWDDSNDFLYYDYYEQRKGPWMLRETPEVSGNPSKKLCPLSCSPQTLLSPPGRWFWMTRFGWRWKTLSGDILCVLLTPHRGNAPLRWLREKLVLPVSKADSCLDTCKTWWFLGTLFKFLRFLFSHPYIEKMESTS